MPLTVEQVPGDFEKKPEGERMKWLDEHAVDSTLLVSFGDCYRHGVKMTHIFKAICQFVAYISSKVNAASSEAIGWAKKLAKAFNKGLRFLSLSIKRDCEYLLLHGKYSDEGVPFTPVDIPEIPEPGTTSKSDRMLWDAIAEFLHIFVNTYPLLKKVRQPLTMSYAQIIESFIEAGENLFGVLDSLKLGAPK